MILIYPIILCSGDHNREEKEKSEVSIKISRISLHKYDKTNRDNDIAVVKLQAPVTFNKHVFPACLPSPEEQLKPGTKCHISGI